MSGLSLVEYMGESKNNSCGYCRSTSKSNRKTKASIEEGSASNSKESSPSDSSTEASASYCFGVWGHFLTPLDYQILLDRGWRRSGRYLYKPSMDKTCCPQYTIRLDVTKFKLSRTQRKVLRAMNEYLKNGTIPKRKVNEEQTMPLLSVSAKKKEKQPPNKKERKFDEQNLTKKKIKRRERAYEKWLAKGLNIQEEQQKRIDKEKARQKTLESFLPQWDDTWKHKLEVKFASINSATYKEHSESEFKLYRKYQSIIHEDKRNSFEDFEQFLAKSPLSDQPGDRIEPKFGSYHEQYFLDGKIIAVGVVDILPRCFSSKYLFYDPDYAFLTLGTYTALREISFIKTDLLPLRSELRYYYMGYYIQSCPKMRYKGKFRPSDLLCDRTFTWVPLSDCLEKLGANNGKFTPWREDEPPAAKLAIDNLNVFFRQKIYPWLMVKQIAPSLNNRQVTDKLESWLGLVGPEAENIAIYLKELNTENDSSEDGELE